MLDVEILKIVAEIIKGKTWIDRQQSLISFALDFISDYHIFGKKEEEVMELLRDVLSIEEKFDQI